MNAVCVMPRRQGDQRVGQIRPLALPLRKNRKEKKNQNLLPVILYPTQAAPQEHGPAQARQPPVVCHQHRQVAQPQVRGAAGGQPLPRRRHRLPRVRLAGRPAAVGCRQRSPPQLKQALICFLCNAGRLLLCRCCGSQGRG